MVDRPLPLLNPGLLDTEVEGRHLRPGPLCAQLGPGPTLLVFLRHFGSPACRQQIAQLAAAREGDAGFPRVVLVHHGTVAEGEAFLAPRWPQVAAIADSTGRLHDAFDLGHVHLRQVLGTRALWRNVTVAFRGHRPGRRIADGRRLPGVFLVHGGGVVWRHRPRFAGDAPDLRAVRVLAGDLERAPA
jgi:hypothetical protein